jgi:hypothetical protein
MATMSPARQRILSCAHRAGGHPGGTRSLPSWSGANAGLVAWRQTVGCCATAGNSTAALSQHATACVRPLCMCCCGANLRQCDVELCGWRRLGVEWAEAAGGRDCSGALAHSRQQQSGACNQLTDYVKHAESNGVPGVYG